MKGINHGLPGTLHSQMSQSGVFSFMQQDTEEQREYESDTFKDTDHDLLIAS